MWVFHVKRRTPRLPVTESRPSRWWSGVGRGGSSRSDAECSAGMRPAGSVVGQGLEAPRIAAESGARLGIKSAGFPAIKTVTDFRFRRPTRESTSGDCIGGRGRARRSPGGVRAGHWVDHPAGACTSVGAVGHRTTQDRSDRAGRDRRGRLHPVRHRSREPVLPVGVEPLREVLDHPDLEICCSRGGVKCSVRPSSPRR